MLFMEHHITCDTMTLLPGFDGYTLMNIYLNSTLLFQTDDIIMAQSHMYEFQYPPIFPGICQLHWYSLSKGSSSRTIWKYQCYIYSLHIALTLISKIKKNMIHDMGLINWLTNWQTD